MVVVIIVFPFDEGPVAQTGDLVNLPEGLGLQHLLFKLERFFSGDLRVEVPEVLHGHHVHGDRACFIRGDDGGAP